MCLTKARGAGKYFVINHFQKRKSCWGIQFDQFYKFKRDFWHYPQLKLSRKFSTLAYVCVLHKNQKTKNILFEKRIKFVKHEFTKPTGLEKSFAANEDENPMLIQSLFTFITFDFCSSSSTMSGTNRTLGKLSNLLIPQQRKL